MEDGSRFKAYLIRNDVSGQCYVGITERNLRARWKQHLVSAHKEEGYYLHDALRTYGFDNFTFLHIASARTRSDLNQLEKALVEQYRAVEYGYNQTRGGASGETVGKPIAVNGQHFISMSAAARHFGVAESAIHQRTGRYGWTLEQAVGLAERPPKTRQGVQVEVGGIVFNSLRAASQHHGLDESATRSRIKLGWTIDQAFGLGPPPAKGRNSGNPIEVGGVQYSNVVRAAKALGLKPHTAAKRLRGGWTIDQAFDLESPPKHEWMGTSVVIGEVEHRSIAQACRRLGKNGAAVTYRLERGWTVDQAFDLAPPPPPSGEKNGKAIVVGGVTYSSHAQAARAYGLDPRVVHKRLNKFGWTLDQAFGLHPRAGKRSRS